MDFILGVLRFLQSVAGLVGIFLVLVGGWDLWQTSSKSSTSGFKESEKKTMKDDFHILLLGLGLLVVSGTIFSFF
uniref:hypothetical protein n=1 Tax=Rhodococcus qingshengii TaxID=334542 RepID=UPI001C4E27D6|nr:hypothetical protein [Rhodococcus qingshengii]